MQGSSVLDIPAREAFEKLLEPKEQLKWNTLYLEVHTEPAGAIRSGTVMTGRFKGSGKATVRFENVIPGEEFTHHSEMMLFNLFPLGEFRHKYRVSQPGALTVFTQTVTFSPKGLGRLLQGMIVKGFKNRLPESFREFKAYAEGSKTEGSANRPVSIS